MAKETNPNIEAIKAFIKDVKSEHEVSGASEQSYRPDLVGLIKQLCDSKTIVRNEGKKTDGVTPDIVVMRKPDNIPIGYIEAKDIDKDIDNLTGANISQFAIYKENLLNLIYTNNLDWNFYRNKELVHSVSIATLKTNATKKTETIVPITTNYAELVIYLQDFLDQRPQTIKSAKELTQYMARKTKIIHDAFKDGLTGRNRLPSLETQYNRIVEQLISGLKPDEFADMYAQTITYGLFVARLNSTPETFNREKLQDLVPENYSFLKDLFEFISKKTLGDTLELYIDDLIEIYRATDDKVIKGYKKSSTDKDPFLYFYEDFLEEYDPAKRKKHGVYYTPEPVVDFIVRSVDWVLKNELNVSKGLANSEKIGIEWKTDNAGNFKDKDVHKVQILDPATGTGTFLAQTIRHIAKQEKESSKGNWLSYIDEDLLPRLHGLEIMMAPYIMCYLKLNMLLAKLGYIPKKKNPERMSIYLTNSLTGANKEISDWGFNNEWLEKEAQGAKDIKDNYPIMCIIGNPPYSGSSQNMGEEAKWIKDLIEDYKYVDGVHFKERKNWLHNDYVKFIRFAQHMVDKNGEGVVGMITDHSYLDGPTFRGMRWNLMKSFDKIYIFDLHGNSKKKEVAPNGDPDVNVFDITQGVSVIIAWKKKRAKGTEKPPAQVFRGDLAGERKTKTDFLLTLNLDSDEFEEIEPRKPFYFFTAQDYDILKEYEKSTEYEKGFKINDFMQDNVTGIVTAKDNLVIDMSKQGLIDKINRFIDKDKTDGEIRQIFFPNKKENKYPPGDSRGWKLGKARNIMADANWEQDIKPIAYRPFDTQYILYRPDMVDWGRETSMYHFLDRDNLGLNIGRQGQVVGSMPWNLIFIQNKISDLNIFYRGGGKIFPLYLYFNDDNDDTATIQPNMEPKIRKAIEGAATDSKHKKPDEKEIFDYIYGILHSPDYREHYAEFLKTDFPYIPYPKTPAEFWHLSSVGTKLRELHLIPKDIDISAHTFDGEDTTPNVKIPRFDGKKVWINDTQYFNNVPKSAWDFYIGGYQPARKWLKDRKGKVLKTLDITHYQRIIAVLVQTKTTMDDIKWSRP